MSPALFTLLPPLMLATGAQGRQVEDGTRGLGVADRAGGPARELRVAPGVITSVVFDTPLDLDAMKAALDALASRFELVDAGLSRTTLMLRPSARFTPGSRQRLEVRFAWGGEPRRAALELVSGTKAEAERQVEVTRPRPREEARLAVLEARGAACEAELDALKARGAMPLALLVLEGELRPEHYQRGGLIKPNPHWRRPDDVVLAQALLYRTRRRAALSLRLSLAPEARRWVAGEVVVVDTRTGQRLSVHGVAMKQPALEPGVEALLVVEWEAAPEPDGIVDVRVMERDGERHIGIGGVKSGTP